jgi:hypothetical protein
MNTSKKLSLKQRFNDVKNEFIIERNKYLETTNNLFSEFNEISTKLLKKEKKLGKEVCVMLKEIFPTCELRYCKDCNCELPIHQHFHIKLEEKDELILFGKIIGKEIEFTHRKSVTFYDENVKTIVQMDRYKTYEFINISHELSIVFKYLEKIDKISAPRYEYYHEIRS